MFSATKSQLTAGLVPVQPNEFNDDYTAKTPAALSAGLQTITSDSGHAYFASGTVGGSFKASPMDSTVVWSLTASSGIGAAYLCASLSGAVYGYARMRFVSSPSQSTHSSAGGVIGWGNVGTNNSEASTGAHVVIEENQLYSQKGVPPGPTFTTIGGPWSFTDPVTAWFTVEWAIYGTTLVVRLPDGTIQSYTDASLGLYVPNWLCVEPVRNLSTDWTPEFSHMKGSTLKGMSAAQLLYYNNLLALGGVGPSAAYDSTLASGSPNLVAVGGTTVGTAGNPTVTFKKVSDGTTYTTVGGEYCLFVAFSDDTNGTIVAPTGYTLVKAQSASTATILSAFDHTAGAGETTAGPPASGTQADGAIALVFTSCGGDGGNNGNGANVSPNVIPVISTLTNSPSGKSRKLYLNGRRGLQSNLNIAAPYGYSRAKVQEGAASGNNSVISAYLADTNFTSDVAQNFSDGAGDQFGCNISLELLGV